MKAQININWIILLLCLSSCRTAVQPADGFTINATINGLEDGWAKLVKLDLNTNGQILVDSTIIQNGAFSFAGHLETPYLHSIIINDAPEKIHIFLENSPVSIIADIDALEQAQVSGSKEDSLFRAYDIEAIFDRKEGMEIMLNYPGYVFSAFTAYYQFQIHNISIDTLSMIMDRFEEPVRQTPYYQHLEKLYTTLMRVAVSQPAPAFSIPDTNGVTVDLADLKGKYVLLDFWASWCAPCRMENPQWVEVYQANAGRDFTILGISVDEDREKWLKAIRKDGLPWINVSNLKGWDELTDEYGVKAIPQNFLLDPDGTIIGKNIKPADLVAILHDRG